MEKTDTRPPFAASGGIIPLEFRKIKTPCYVLDETALIKNAELMGKIAERTGCKMLLAQKAFSNYDCYHLLEPYLAGTEASGLYEARLGAQEMPGKEVHVFCAGYREDEFEELLCFADHIVFNSPSQLLRFGKRAKQARLGAQEMPGKEVHVFCAGYREDEFEELLCFADHIVFNSPSQLLRFGKRAKQAGKSVGLRINPECSTQEGHAIYDPCAPGSRMGTTRAQWEAAVKMHPDLTGLLDGIHFHTLCEQDSSDLETTLAAVKVKFGDLISKVKWLNLGGGHHITRPGYDIARLEKCIEAAKEEWKVDIYLEPGEAWALNAGFFLTTVLDVLQNGDTRLAILDGSAACHMPDVLEMPYRPPLLGAGEPGENAVTVRLGGPTCLSGDVIGDYSFQKPLAYGDLLMFGDMAIYTTCKNNTFNGMPLPDIWLRHGDKTMERLTDFGYEDFKGRLGHRRKSE